MAIHHNPHGWGDARALASRMKQRITIEQSSDADDEAGGFTRSWSTLATVWAEVLPLHTGRIERLFAAQHEHRATHRITIRYRSDVTAAMRISYDGRYFNIRSVTNINEANVMLEMLAEEGVAI